MYVRTFAPTVTDLLVVKIYSELNDVLTPLVECVKIVDNKATDVGETVDELEATLLLLGVVVNVTVELDATLVKELGELLVIMTGATVKLDVTPVKLLAKLLNDVCILLVIVMVIVEAMFKRVVTLVPAAIEELFVERAVVNVVPVVLVAKLYIVFVLLLHVVLVTEAVNVRTDVSTLEVDNLLELKGTVVAVVLDKLKGVLYVDKLLVVPYTVLVVPYAILVVPDAVLVEPDSELVVPDTVLVLTGTVLFTVLDDVVVACVRVVV